MNEVVFEEVIPEPDLNQEVQAAKELQGIFATFDIQPNYDTSTLDISFWHAEQAMKSLDQELALTEPVTTVSVPTDFTKERIGKALVVGTFIFGGTIIGGPLGLIVAAKMTAVGAAVGAVTGAAVGYGLWDKVTQLKPLQQLQSSIYNLTKSNQD